MKRIALRTRYTYPKRHVFTNTHYYDPVDNPQKSSWVGKYHLGDIVIHERSMSPSDPVISPLVEVDGMLIHPQNMALLYNKDEGIEIDKGFIKTPMIYSCAWCREMKSERNAVTALATILKIEDNALNSRSWLDGRTGWHHYSQMIDFIPESLQRPISRKSWTEGIKNKDGFISCIMHIDNELKTLLPVTAWTKDRVEKRFYLNLPHPKPYPLIDQGEISKDIDSIVLLTDSIEIESDNKIKAFDENVTGITWTSWYGERAAVLHVDWSCLKNHTVCYLITEHAGMSLKAAYDIAYAVYKQLRNIKDIKLGFVEYLKSADGSPFQFMTCEDFEKKARVYLGLDKPPVAFRPMSMQEMLSADFEKRELLLEPLLLECSTTLMYAETHVGKTWLGLCMGFIISCGGKLFGAWRAKTAWNVLYIDSEMDERSMQERMNIISKMRFNGRRPHVGGAKRFFCISKKRGGLANKEFQDYVVEYAQEKNISFLVLDNLSSFTQHNDSAKAWEDIHVWLDKMRERGCAILVLHHTNKAGDQRGTSATTNAVDNVIHLEKIPMPEDLNALGIAVHIKKGRDVDGETRQSFRINIFPKAKPPKCDYAGIIEDSGNSIVGENTKPMKAKAKDGANTTGKKPEAPESGKPNGGASEWENKPISIGDYIDEERNASDDTENSNALPKNEANKNKARRSPEKRKEDAERVFFKLRDGKTIRDIAKEMGMSVSAIYQIKGITESKHFKDMQARRDANRDSRNADILSRHGAKQTLKEITNALNAKGDKTTITTVRRIVDEHQMSKVAPLLERACSPEQITKKTNIPSDTVKRIIRKINLGKIKELFKEQRALDYIQEYLNLPEAVVKREISKLEACQEERIAREQAEIKLRELYGKGFEEKDIIDQVNLPELTVKRLLGKLRKNSSDASVDDASQLKQTPESKNPKRLLTHKRAGRKQ